MILLRLILLLTLIVLSLTAATVSAVLAVPFWLQRVLSSRIDETATGMKRIARGPGQEIDGKR